MELLVFTVRKGFQREPRGSTCLGSRSQEVSRNVRPRSDWRYHREKVAFAQWAARHYQRCAAAEVLSLSSTQ